MTPKPDVDGYVGRIAGALRDRSHVVPQSYEFQLTSDRFFRVTDVFVRDVRTLIVDTRRGILAKPVTLFVRRRDGDGADPWLADDTSARDEGGVLDALESGVRHQLSAWDFERRDADARIDVRPDAADLPAPYVPRHSRRAHAAGTVRGSLTVVLAMYVLAWVVYGIGMVSAPEPPEPATATLMGMVFAQFIGSLALWVGGMAGRNAYSSLALVTGGIAFVLTPVAVVVHPIGPVIALLGGILLLTGCVFAAGAPPLAWIALPVFAAFGLVGITVASAVGGAPPAGSTIVALAMVLGSLAAAAVVRPQLVTATPTAR